MNWRMALGVIAGALIPVPMLLVMGSVWTGAHAPTPEDTRASPMLSFEERMQHVTYHRHCQKPSDCEPPMGCLMDARLLTHYCTDSQCITDEQCPDDLVCRELATVNGGPLVRLCIPLGFRKEGEQCMELPPDREHACELGLLCAGNRKAWCGRPCRRDGATSCPDGFFCADLEPEPICLPTCEARGCPEGQQCIRHYDGASQCAVIYGPNCQQSPCPAGRECRDKTSILKPGKVWTECVEQCGPGKPACPEGFTCDRWHCLPSCDPQDPNTCANGYRCQQGKKPDRPWVCQPDT